DRPSEGQRSSRLSGGELIHVVVAGAGDHVVLLFRRPVARGIVGVAVPARDGQRVGAAEAGPGQFVYRVIFQVIDLGSTPGGQLRPGLDVASDIVRVVVLGQDGCAGVQVLD